MPTGSVVSGLKSESSVNGKRKSVDVKEEAQDGCVPRAAVRPGRRLSLKRPLIILIIYLLIFSPAEYMKTTAKAERRSKKTKKQKKHTYNLISYRCENYPS